MYKITTLAAVLLVGSANAQLVSLGGGLQRLNIAQPQFVRTLVAAAPLGLINEDPFAGPPIPYSFAYGTDDAQGTTSHRREESDGRAVRGSYGYTDADGIARIVEYVADENGYRANIRTNEPGVGRNEQIGDPADTAWDIQQTPPHVQERYLQAQPLVRVLQAPQPAVTLLG